jgi:hypothetical protein
MISGKSCPNCPPSTLAQNTINSPEWRAFLVFDGRKAPEFQSYAQSEGEAGSGHASGF